MRFIGDYHMHTRYSDGRATVREMVEAGRAMGLEEVAITDHGPRNIGTGVSNARAFLSIKNEADDINNNQEGIKVLVGAEADVTGVNGEIDVPEDIYRQLDMLLVGLHPYVLPETSGFGMILGNPLYKLSGGMRRKVINTNTKALVEVMQRHPVDVITHPGLQMPIDVAEVARACSRTDTAFEVNIGHDYQSPATIQLAAREGVKFIINSDAHYPETVGHLESGLALLQQAKVPIEQIVNVSP